MTIEAPPFDSCDVVVVVVADVGCVIVVVGVAEEEGTVETKVEIVVDEVGEVIEGTFEGLLEVATDVLLSN